MPLKNPPVSQLRCPCAEKTELQNLSGRLVCSGEKCEHGEVENGFSIKDARAILISASRCDTLCDPHEIESRVQRSNEKLSAVRRFIGSGSGLTEQNCAVFIEKAKKGLARRRILVIGSGEPGIGTEAIWSADDLDVYGTDIYLTKTVSTVCDAHYLPFADGFFDGVWIQAVLEHVVDPQIVVGEILRVLGPQGVVYSEIPFMQQVHEGAYDFTRFTISGHRYLFKRFEAVKLGALDGPGAALSWGFRYWVWGLTRSRNIARASALLLSLITKLLAPFESHKSRFDSYSGSFFLGIKSDQTIRQKDLLSLYDGNIS